MIDPASLLTGAGLVFLGYGSGRVGRVRRHPKPPKAPKPVCGCGHHHSFHDGDGRCQHVETVTIEEKEIQRNEGGKAVRDSWDNPVFVRKVKEVLNQQCACQRYTGPEPYTSFYAPEIGG